ncbi:azurin, partial [Pseudomonas sp. ABAC61]
MFAKLVAVSLLTLASSQLMAAECKVDVDSTDQMSFNTKEITIDKSCKTFTVNLTHSGSLPKNVMGHNWVLSKTADMAGIAADGMAAGIDKSYLKEGDTRVIAHT